MIPAISVTADESDHLDYAIRILKGQPEKIRPFDDASTMPVSVLNAIPRGVEQVANPGLEKKDWGQSDIMQGRYVTLLVCLLTGLFIFQWAKELFGERAALLSFFLFVFCPNLNAHQTLVTTDAYSALFTITSLYYFWKLTRSGQWRHLVLMSISLGAAQLTKQSLTHLVLIIGILSLYILIKRGTVFKQFQKFFLRFIVALVIGLIVINAGFLFRDTGKSLGDYQFNSHLFRSVQSAFSYLQSVPLPLPSPYVEGLDLTKSMDEIGPGDPRVAGRNYLLGEYRSGGGFWNYYLVVFGFKTPLLVLAGFLFLLFRYLIRRRPSFSENEGILLFTIFYFLVYFSLFVNTQPGIRHLILIFPLVYVLMGEWVIITLNHKYKNWLAVGVMLYSIVTFYVYYPNLISYTNELIMDKKKAYSIMADSNLDYRQGNKWLATYLNDNPDVKLPGSVPVPGKLIIGVNDYLNLDQTNRYEWLKRNFKPVGHFKHCFLLFEVGESELQEKGLLIKK